MKRAVVAVARFAFNLEYRIAKRTGAREDLVVFLSRQTNEPSYDFRALAAEFERRGWKSTMHLKKVTRKTLVPYARHVLREVKLLARCKVAVLDRYDPVVSLLDFESELVPHGPDVRNWECPTQPVVLQIWHAFGAYKKFGYQSTDTLEGHTSEFADTFDIHRNYSWVLCSGERCRQAFAQAFSYPVERVVALNRPEYDELVEMRKEAQNAGAAQADAGARGAGAQNAGAAQADAGKPAANKPAAAPRRVRILMAPTLRKARASRHPFRELYVRREMFERGIDADITWSFHPLEEKLPAPGNVSDALVSSDVVVTDYSSIAYEAYALGKRVVFFVPDIEEYRASPGLNADPLALSPGICTLSVEQLQAVLAQLVRDPGSYAHDALRAFAASAFDPDDGTSATARIVDFALCEVVRNAQPHAQDAHQRRLG